MGANVLELLFVELAELEPADAGLRQLAFQVLVNGFLDGVQLAYARIDGVELLIGGHERLGVEKLFIHQGKVDQASDANHEEFSQVAFEDGYELEPFQQGNGRVCTLIEHPLVEFEPGKLAILHEGHALLAFLLRIGVVGHGVNLPP